MAWDIKYETNLFVDLYPNYESFLADYNDIADVYIVDIPVQEKHIKNWYYLMYSAYGNSPLAYTDETQFKFKMFAIFSSNGLRWIKEKEIQKEILKLDLSSDDILVTAKSIYNTARHPEDEPGTESTTELPYINDQNVAIQKRGKATGLTLLYELLKSNYDEKFIKKFKPLFRHFLGEQDPAIYTTYVEEVD